LIRTIASLGSVRLIAPRWVRSAGSQEIGFGPHFDRRQSLSVFLRQLRQQRHSIAGQGVTTMFFE